MTWLYISLMVPSDTEVFNFDKVQLIHFFCCYDLSFFVFYEDTDILS